MRDSWTRQTYILDYASFKFLDHTFLKLNMIGLEPYMRVILIRILDTKYGWAGAS